MPSRAALTPSQMPGIRRAFCITIPDSPEWRALFVGAIADLATPERWEGFGAVTPDDAAEAVNRAILTVEWCSMIGSIVAWAYKAGTAPDGWLDCDGGDHLAEDYPQLWEVIDPHYKITSDRFVTPNLQGRSIVHPGITSEGTRVYSQNIPTGQERVAPENATMLQHSHTMAHTHGYTGQTGVTGIAFSPGELPVVVALLPSPSVTGGSSAVRTGNQGGGQSHDNVPPVLPLRYMIKAKG